VREQRTLGSVRGAVSNGRPYRDSLGFAPARQMPDLSFFSRCPYDLSECACGVRRQASCSSVKLSLP